MQSFEPIEQNYLEARRGIVRRLLIWITARDRTTGAPYSTGFWNGDDHVEFTIGGVARTYYGAGAALQFDDLVVRPGFEVQTTRVELVAVHPQVAAAFRGYDARLAPVEIHSAVFDLDSRALIAEPRRIFKGEIDKQPVRRGADGGGETISVEMVSSARFLTRTLPLYKSDAALQARAPGDTFRKDAATAGRLTLFWGSKRLETKDAAPAARPGKDSRSGESGGGHPYGR